MEIGPPTPNLEWQSRMMTKLTEWKTEYGRIRLPSPAVDRSTTPSSSYSHQGESVSSSATPFVNGEWIDLTYNLTVSLLFRPSPNNPRPDSNGLQQAFTASGLAMKIYRSMHRSSTINFPWLATHHLFISGLTHLNALEKLTRIGSSCPSPIVEVVFNVQSCASTLEALTSRDDGYGTRIRDTFDAAASAVLRTVLEPGSSMVPSATTSFGPGTNTTADIASVEDFIRGSATTSVDSGPGRYTDRSRSSSWLTRAIYDARRIMTTSYKAHSTRHGFQTRHGARSTHWMLHHHLDQPSLSQHHHVQRGSALLARALSLLLANARRRARKTLEGSRMRCRPHHYQHFKVQVHRRPVALQCIHMDPVSRRPR